MVNVLLFDTTANRASLAPFTDTRPIATLRVGMRTILEKWMDYWPDRDTFSCLTADYLQPKFPLTIAEHNLCINGTFLPTEALIKALYNLEPGDVMWYEGEVLAFWQLKQPKMDLDHFSEIPFQYGKVNYPGKLVQIKNKWDIFLQNELAIQDDFKRIRAKRTSQSITDPHTIVYNQQDIFIEEGASIRAAILNAEAGPIYIGKNVVIEEHAVLKGPVAICEGAQVKVGSNLSNGTTIGPYSKVGGEVSNSVIFEYSNKAHSGFMGNSVIGEWCNLGANSTTSNLRHDYGHIQVWDQVKEKLVDTGLQFCGLFLGAFSKCGISTMFNTGTVIGTCSNLFGAGYMKRFLPAFTKGSPPDRYFIYPFNQALESIENTLARRDQELTTIDRDILVKLYDQYIPQNVKWLLSQPFWVTTKP
jgi:UDP-N-acetylglucosamine diphosphorylase/glucosamine-1-phosphate N-acetyltransferase